MSADETPDQRRKKNAEAAAAAKRRALADEGTGMLKAIQRNEGINMSKNKLEAAPAAPVTGQLVDSSGHALTNSRVIPSDQPVITHHNPNADHEQRLRQLEIRRLANAKRLAKVLSTSQDMTEMNNIMHLAYKMVYYCKLELAAHPDITDAMIDDMGHIHQEAIMNNAQKFDVRKIRAQLTSSMVPFMDRRIKIHESEGKRKQHRMEVLKRLLPEGLPIPPEVRKALQYERFRPGRVLVACGKPVAVRALFKALLQFAEPLKFDFGYFHTDGAPTFSRKGQLFPEAWWKGGAETQPKLDGVFEPVVDEGAVLVGLDDYRVFGVAREDVSSEENLGLIVKSLHIQCSDNLICGVFGDPEGTPEDYARFVPAVSVVLDARGSLLIDGKYYGSGAIL